MKKRKGKISNKLAYTLITVVCLALISVGVYAYGTSSPSTMGHTLGEIAPPSQCSSGQVLSWTGSAWTCTTISSSSIQFQRVSQTFSSGNSGSVSCPSGKYPIGGGCQTGDFGATLVASFPTGGKWSCYYNTGISMSFTAHVICADTTAFIF